MEAVSLDYFSIVQFLLKNKADIYVRDSHGKDVKSYAANSKRCLDLIESYDHMKDAVDNSSRNQGRKCLAGSPLMSEKHSPSELQNIPIKTFMVMSSLPKKVQILDIQFIQLY